MAHSRKYEGIGVLLILGERFDGIRYMFEARLVNNRIMADGFLTMNSATGVMKAFRAGGAILQLQTGETVDIVMTEATSSRAKIKISGTIPGFP